MYEMEIQRLDTFYQQINKTLANLEIRRNRTDDQEIYEQLTEAICQMHKSRRHCQHRRYVWIARN